MKVASLLSPGVVFILSFMLTPNTNAQINISNLRCEHLLNPLGIDDASPLLSWELQSDERGKKQTAFQIMVAADPMELKGNTGSIWATGKVNKNNNQVLYSGKPLVSGKKYYWRVRVWDEKNKVSDWSEIQYWSMGLLHKEDWKAKWIGQAPVDPVTEQDKYVIPPSPLLRKEFDISGKIRRATLYATALGIYEIYLNGKKAGNRFLAPEWTDYARRVQYQTYDVTNLIDAEKNVIGAALADGWYAGSLWSHFYRGRYGINRRLKAQLLLEYTDGSTDTVCTDDTWKILKEGPIREASLFDGEVYDERFNPKGWMEPGFDISCWQNVVVDDSVSLQLNAQMNEPIKVVKELKPVGIIEVKREKYDPLRYIIDMGQNMSGWVKIALPENPGKKIILRYGEMLTEDSMLYTKNLRNAKARDIYIPGKEEHLFYEPRFTYHGFRYIEITGLARAPELSQITGMVLASSSPVVAEFQTSSEDVNKLWANILWTQLGNLHSVPTDCPQRDERAGWMGDAQVFAQTAMFNMDMQAFYTKWFRDIRDEQVDGRFSNYAPYITQGLRYYDAPGWADAGVIIPWKAFVNYGNTQILDEHFEAMCRFIDFVHEKNPTLIRVNETGQNYGDWLNGNSIKAAGYPETGGAIPKEVFNTAYFAYSTALLAKTCKVLKKEKEFRYYDSLAGAIRNVFIKTFITSDGMVKGNTQAGYAMALEFDLVPEELRNKTINLMIDAVKAYDYRISTGIHTTERLMNQLSVNAYPELAYKLLESHRFPSWMYSIDQGATTIWERWDGFVKGRGFQDFDMNSFNHYAIGSVGEWMYKHIIGIRPDEKTPGYRHFILQPVPGGSLTWAKGGYHSVIGKIEVSWEKRGEGFLYNITIPVNSSATLILPTRKEIREGSTPVQKAKGVRILSNKDGHTTLLLASGKYQLTF